MKGCTHLVSQAIGQRTPWRDGPALDRIQRQCVRVTVDEHDPVARVTVHATAARGVVATFR